VTERNEAHEELLAGGIIDAWRWIRSSAHSGAWADFDQAKGHDRAVLGYISHKLMCDRHDRVFSCGRYAVESPEDALAGLDVVAEGLAEGEFERMPRIAPGLVVRANLTQSPGWRYGRWRWLLGTFDYGEIDNISWAQKSRTKQRVSAQPDPEQLLLPSGDDGMFGDLFGTVRDLATAEVDTDAVTLVIAHAIDLTSGGSQMYLGRSAFNLGGGPPWYWKIDLSEPGLPGGGSRTVPVSPKPNDPNLVPDAPVRLRPKSVEGRRDNASDQA
jgi:hypothetical protein